MIAETPDNQTREKTIKRPSLLTVLCILTFVGSGLNIFSGLIVGAFFPEFTTIAADLAETYKMPGMELITEGSPAFFFISAFFYAGSVGGAYLMWKMMKNGFHVYTISQILLLITPMYFFKLPISWADLILTGFFVIMYSLFYKIMQ